MKNDDIKSQKLQPSVEAYTYYVVSNLIGIKGKNHSDVTAFILKDWIGDHQTELSDYGIDVTTWKSTLGEGK